MVKRSVLVVAALVLALSACSKSDGGSDASGSGAGGSKTTTTAAKAGTGCSKDSGKPGFVRAFCDGSATVTFDIGGNKGSIGGGDCEESGGYFTVNAGTVVGPEWKGAQPDYAGFLLPVKAGDFEGGGVTASITYKGVAVLLKDAKGTHDSKSASFTATDMQGGGPVTVSVTC